LRSKRQAATSKPATVSIAGLGCDFGLVSEDSGSAFVFSSALSAGLTDEPDGDSAGSRRIGAWPQTDRAAIWSAKGNCCHARGAKAKKKTGCSTGAVTGVTTVLIPLNGRMKNKKQNLF
jgi:hypothetical protein